MPLTEEQQKAYPVMREMFASLLENPPPVAKPFEERARLPTTGIPEDIIASVEIAPPSSLPFPLINSEALKRQEHVPIFFYALRREGKTEIPLEGTKVILHMHGGGNVALHPADESFVSFFANVLRQVSSDLGDTGKCIIAAPCYRLATVPENTFPAALQDVLSAYDYVLSKGYKPSNIMISGDSAGGNHALVSTYLASQSNRPLPSGIITIAPCAIQTYDNLSEFSKSQSDLIPISTYAAMSNAYVVGTSFSLTDPLVSGAYLPFSSVAWPRTLVLVGTADHLIDAGREVEKNIREAGKEVKIVEYEDVPHGWWVAGQVFPDTVSDAARMISQFMRGGV